MDKTPYKGEYPRIPISASPLAGGQRQDADAVWDAPGMHPLPFFEGPKIALVIVTLHSRTPSPVTTAWHSPFTAVQVSRAFARRHGYLLCQSMTYVAMNQNFGQADPEDDNEISTRTRTSRPPFAVAASTGSVWMMIGPRKLGATQRSPWTIGKRGMSYQHGCDFLQMSHVRFCTVLYTKGV